MYQLLGAGKIFQHTLGEVDKFYCNRIRKIERYKRKNEQITTGKKKKRRSERTEQMERYYILIIFPFLSHQNEIKQY